MFRVLVRYGVKARGCEKGSFLVISFHVGSLVLGSFWGGGGIWKRLREKTQRLHDQLNESCRRNWAATGKEVETRNEG
jgi:hypothetical protein